MRILHLAKYYPPATGGIERFTGDLAEGCARAGDAASVLCFHGARHTAREERQGVPVTRAATLGVVRSQPVSLSYGSLARAAAADADVVHLHEPNPLGEWAARDLSAPLVVSWHSGIVGRPLLAAALAPMRRATLARARRIVTATPRHLEASPELAAHKDRCRVIPYGVDPERFRPGLPVPPAYAPLRERHHPLALFVGRLVPYKGLGVLLEALAATDLHLAVVGEGPEEARLRVRARALGLDGRVHWAGTVDDGQLPTWYAMADLFVLPSLDVREMFGIAMLEAMACGLPAVCSNLPGPSWVNGTGPVFPPGDAAALAAAMRSLASDPARRREIGAASRARVLAHFTLAGMVAAWREIYMETASA